MGRWRGQEGAIESKRGATTSTPSATFLLVDEASLAGALTLDMPPGLPWLEAVRISFDVSSGYDVEVCLYLRDPWRTTLERTCKSI
jgi:hypothetical protein